MQYEVYDQDEYAEFLNIVPSRLVLANPPEKLARQLVGSRLWLGFIYFGGCVFGYLLSLALCAQCSVALSPIAHQTAKLMSNLSSGSCALTCGIIFGSGPLIASSLFLSKFQHRYLLFKMPWLVAFMPISANVLLTVAGSIHDYSWHAIWLTSALGTPYITELLFARSLKQLHYRVAIESMD